MPYDIKCPYCDGKININHDDGYGYSESVTHSQQCPDCEKYFVYETQQTFSYEAKKADCLNGSDHKFSPTFTYPMEFTAMECETCGEKRSITKEEMTDLKLKISKQHD